MAIRLFEYDTLWHISQALSHFRQRRVSDTREGHIHLKLRSLFPMYPSESNNRLEHQELKFL